MKSDKYWSHIEKVKQNLRHHQFQLDSDYRQLNNTFIRYFKKDLEFLANNNKKIALFKPIIDPKYGINKAKTKGYDKSFPFKLGSFALTGIFKMLSWITFIVPKALTFWDIQQRYDRVEQSYLMSKRDGDKQVFKEVGGFAGSNLLGGAMAPIMAGIGLSAGIAVGGALGSGLMGLPGLFLGSALGGSIGAAVGTITGVAIFGTLGDYLGVNLGEITFESKEALSEAFMKYWPLNKHKIVLPLYIDGY